MLLRVGAAAVALSMGACDPGRTAGAGDAPSQAPPASAITAPASAAPDRARIPCADDAGARFTWLLRAGERLPASWEHTGTGAFVPTGDGVRTSGGIGLLWYAKRPFRDLELRLEWRVASPDDNSGVFVRFPAPADAAEAVPGDLEIQIYDGAAGEPQRTGALYDVQREQRRNWNPPGTWNQYCIRAVDNRVTVVLNGLVVNRYQGAMPRSGHIGLQNHGPDDDVVFRRVRIRELGSRPR